MLSGFGRIRTSLRCIMMSNRLQPLQPDSSDDSRNRLRDAAFFYDILKLNSR